VFDGGALTGIQQGVPGISTTGTSTITNLNVTGVSTFVGNAQFDGNVSIAGSLTYEDVTNIDSLGIVTARTGIKVLAGGINAVGVVTATSFSGDGSNLSGVGFEQDSQGNLVAGTGAGAVIDSDTCFNIMIGCNSGRSNCAGDHNLFLGCNAGCLLTSSCTFSNH
jgi:hypothetical protein